jgi:hypothetical protein
LIKISRHNVILCSWRKTTHFSGRRAFAKIRTHVLEKAMATNRAQSTGQDSEQDALAYLNAMIVLLGWESDSSGRLPAWQVQGPEFNLQYRRKRKKKKKDRFINFPDTTIKLSNLSKKDDVTFIAANLE